MSLEISNFHGFPIVEFQRFMESEHHFPAVRKMVPHRLFTDHFVGVSKMVPVGPLGMKAEAHELEAKIAESVVELLEQS